MLHLRIRIMMVQVHCTITIVCLEDFIASYMCGTFVVYVGAIGGLFIIAVAVFVSLLVKEKRRMKDYFRKNGVQ